MAMKKLTNAVAAATQPAARPQIFWDSELKGFHLKITPGGAKVWLLYYRTTQGRERRPAIGRYPGVTASQARAIALEWRAAIARGEDPSDARLRERRVIKLTDFAERYLSDHALPHKKPRSVVEDRRNLSRHILPALGSLRMSEITRADIASFVSRMGAIPVTANRCRTLLSKMFSLAELWGLRPEGSNPIRYIPKFKEHRRERYLSSEEIKRLGDALVAADLERSLMPSVTLAVRLLLLTGCRLSEILTLQWDQVDIAGRRLIFPDSKTGPKTIPLNAAALDLLAKAHQGNAGRFVIAGRKHGSHLVNLQKPWRALCRKAGITGANLHCLRHTFATTAAGLHFGLPVIGKLLGHSQPQTTARYAHLSSSPLEQASDRVSSVLVAAMSGRTAEVVPLARTAS